MNGIGYFLANFLLSKNLKCSTEIVSILSAQVIVGVFFGSIILKEKTTKNELIGSLLILFGIFWGII